MDAGNKGQCISSMCGLLQLGHLVPQHVVPLQCAAILQLYKNTRSAMAGHAVESYTTSEQSLAAAAV